MTSKHAWWVSAECGSLTSARESVLPSGEAADELSPPGCQTLKICKTHHLLPYLSGSFRHQQLLAGCLYVTEAAWQLPYNNIPSIICPWGGSVSNRGDKRVERKRSLGVRYRRYLFDKLQRRETALQTVKAIRELIIPSSLHMNYGAQEA